ncbi:MAG: 4Fe-4S dicluster domain-containing protein [Chloroflexota bacterium]
MAAVYPLPVHPRATGYTDSILSAPIPNEAELTANSRIDPGQPYGFFTDTTLCIGCKACEVACKEWNRLPADGFTLTGQSYDNTGALSANTWRHVAFVEQITDAQNERATAMQPFQSNWLMMSDVCKHCERAGCLESCPTGALFKTEFGTVVVQQDICNGCGYCVPSCPFGVIELDTIADGRAHKCTLCYDRMKGGFEPACAKACPTNSIQFGDLRDLQERATNRVLDLQRQGVTSAYLYGAPNPSPVSPSETTAHLGADSGGRLPTDAPGSTGGIGDLHAFFLLTDRPEVYNLPTAPTLPSTRIGRGLRNGLATMAGLAAAAALAFLVGGQD